MQVAANHIHQCDTRLAMASVWSVEESVKLIDMVKNYPVLWQTDHKLYGRKGPRDAAMRKVGLYKDFGETRGKVVFLYLLARSRRIGLSGYGLSVYNPNWHFSITQETLHMLDIV